MFAQNKRQDNYFFTSDDQGFYDAQNAAAHAGKLADKTVDHLTAAEVDVWNAEQAVSNEPPTPKANTGLLKGQVTLAQKALDKATANNDAAAIEAATTRLTAAKEAYVAAGGSLD